MYIPRPSSDVQNLRFCRSVSSSKPLYPWRIEVVNMCHPSCTKPCPLALQIFWWQVAETFAALSYKMFAPCLPTQRFETWVRLKTSVEKVIPFNQSDHDQWICQWFINWKKKYTPRPHFASVPHDVCCATLAADLKRRLVKWAGASLLAKLLVTEKKMGGV